MSNIIAYLQREQLLLQEEELRKLAKIASKYTLIEDKLYKRGFSTRLLKCVSDTKAQEIMKEVHGGICSSHVGGKALATMILRTSYYWSTMKRDSVEYVKKCNKCQRHAAIPRAPPTNLQSVVSTWPFSIWGVDILGPFPMLLARSNIWW